MTMAVLGTTQKMPTTAAVIPRGTIENSERHRQSLKPNTEITDKGGQVSGMGSREATAPMTTAAGVPSKMNEEDHHMSINEMEAKARELRQLQTLIEEAEQEIEAIKDALKAAMGDREIVQAGEYKITWKAITTARIDTTALKKALPEVAERFTRETTTRRFTVA